MATKISEYKGHPTIEFHESADCSDKLPITMGIRKVKAVLLNAQEAVEFVKKFDKEQVKQTDSRQGSPVIAV